MCSKPCMTTPRLRSFLGVRAAQTLNPNLYTPRFLSSPFTIRVLFFLLFCFRKETPK